MTAQIISFHEAAKRVQLPAAWAARQSRVLQRGGEMEFQLYTRRQKLVDDAVEHSRDFQPHW